MPNKTRRVAVIDGCRTPFLRSGTGYYDLMAWELGRFAVKGLIAKTGISSGDIGHVIMGSVASDVRTTNVAREISLGAGLPDNIPAHTCTVACVSANMAITAGADLITNGQCDAVIAGGVESNSDADIKISRKYRRFIMDIAMYNRPKNKIDLLKRIFKLKFRDVIIPEKPSISDYTTGLTMGENAERLAKRLGISRGEQDEFAALSHRRAVSSTEGGFHRKEIVPVVVPGKGVFTSDNGPRKEADLSKMPRLKPAFDRKYGTVTAANSSFLTDGAAAVLLMDEKKAKSLGLKPRAYIRSYAYSGQDLLEELLLGPSFSIPMALKKAGLKFSDIGVFEIHEAFAAQIIANIICMDSVSFAKERLGLSVKIGEMDINKMNRHGGSLSLGHPFGATGARLVATCCNRMIEEKSRYGIVAACGGGAIGNTIVLESAK